MERFIIGSPAYRNYYVQFMNYLHAVGYSLSSRKTFSTGIKEFLYWLEKQKITTIHAVAESDIETFYAYLQERPSLIGGGALSESRITLHMYTLKLFFQHLQDMQQLDLNPMCNLNYTCDYKRIRANLLSVADIESLYEVCSTSKQRAILGILYGCGLRKQEAVNLNASDIYFKSGLLYVREGKGGRKRTIPLSKTVLNDLKDYYFHERPGEIKRRSIAIESFMLNQYGTRMQGDSYSRAIKNLVHKAKLDALITPHHFRHAIATHLIESGMKLEHVKDFLGHKSIETTQTYTHITTTQLKKTTSYETNTLPI